MQPGFVYVLSNPGLTAFKVGMTTRALYLRRDELQREYGTVFPFVIASRHAVDDPATVEALAHSLLDRYRVPRSELFTCDLATCQAAILKAARTTLQRPLWLRAWHSFTLPRPRPSWPRYTRRRGDATELYIVLVVAVLLVVLAWLRPDLPPWLPSSVLRVVAMIERR